MSLPQLEPYYTEDEYLEHYLRQPNGAWLYSRAFGLETSISLATIDCAMRLVDVYDRVKFPPEPPNPENPENPDEEFPDTQ